MDLTGSGSNIGNPSFLPNSSFFPWNISGGQLAYFDSTVCVMLATLLSFLEKKNDEPVVNSTRSNYTNHLWPEYPPEESVSQFTFKSISGEVNPKMLATPFSIETNSCNLLSNVSFIDSRLSKAFTGSTLSKPSTSLPEIFFQTKLAKLTTISNSALSQIPNLMHGIELRNSSGSTEDGLLEFVRKEHFNSCMRTNSYIYNIFVVLCYVFIILGNGLVLILPIFHKKQFRFPIFITVQSLAAAGLLNVVEMVLTSLTSCEMLSIRSVCVFVLSFRGYVRNVFTMHWSLLAVQRMFLTLFPLKAKVYHTQKFIRITVFCFFVICLITEIFLIFCTSLRSCSLLLSSNLFLKEIFIQIDFIALSMMTCLMIIMSTIICTIKQLMSSKNIQQSAGQRKQSRLASVVVILYITIYCPLIISIPFIFEGCTSTLTVQLVTYLVELSRLTILTLSPIILCLRSPEVKNTIKSRVRSMCI